MNDISLKAIFNRPPKDAQAFLESKNYVITNTWRDLPAEAHAVSFTVARAAKLEILQAIKEELDRAMQEGLPFSDFQKNLKPRLQALGWWGKAIDQETGEITQTYGSSGKPVELGSPRRLETIFRTNMQTAYMAGRWKQIEDEASDAPFVQYIAVMDDRTRPSHAALNHRVFRVDDPVWKFIAPPNGYNCRCRVRNFDTQEIESRGLSISKSDGHIRTELVPSRSGEQVKRTIIQLPGMDRPFSPDIGWDYNPAKAKALWDKNYNVDLKPEPNQKTYLDYLRPAIAAVDESLRLNTPEVLKLADSRDEALQILANALGVSEASPLNIISSPVEEVVIDFGMLNHIVEKTEAARERYANFIIPTLENPYEVWLSEYSDGGFRHRYIGLFKDKNLLVIVRINKDSSIIYNMMPAKDAYINKQRTGILAYGK